MLNTEAIQRAMQRAGLNQSALADACGVSKESVSNWIGGQSIPRPSKLKSLASVLSLDLSDLMLQPRSPTPVVAYRSFRGRAVSDAAKLAAQQAGAGLRQLIPFMPRPLLSPRFLEEPSTADDYVEQVAAEQRDFLRLGKSEVPSVDQIVDLLRQCGAILVPVLWGMDKHGHENALSVYLKEPHCIWVVFNLGCYVDDIKYWLAHELGHCLTLHKLQDAEGEAFAEKFARKFLLPDSLAMHFYEDIQRDPASKMATATRNARAHGISVISVIRSADAQAKLRELPLTGLDTDHLYETWKRAQKEMPTFAQEMFGNEMPDLDVYVDRAEERFKTPVFEALEKWQVENGGPSPAYLSTALNIDIYQAKELADCLVKRQLARGAASPKSA